MTENRTATHMVQVSLINDYDDVTDPAIAAELVLDLMGEARAVEYDGFPGSWLVAFTDDELAELKENRFFGRENDIRTLEAEWI
jgi:hypothetical protein